VVQRRTDPRLDRLPLVEVLGREVPLATGLRPRLLGLARLERDLAGPGLLIPRCSSVHTFGMRFALDIFFLDERGAILSVRRWTPPRRVVFCAGARSVLETPSVKGGEISPPRP
jgi:uncharacterized protein